MNANRYQWLSIYRYLFVFLSVMILLFVSADARATGDLFSKPATASAAFLACGDVNCHYLPVISAPDTCMVGQTLIDPTNDVAPAYVDVTSLTSSVSGTTLTAVLKLRDVPTSLTFDRVGVNANFLEYAWMIHVDLDNNLNTGYPNYPERGTEIFLSSEHFVSRANSPVTMPIQNGVQTSTWIYDSSFGGWSFGTFGSLSVDPTGNTMVLSGTIPGLTANSRLVFETYDYNPGGSIIKDVSICSVSSAAAPQGSEGLPISGWQLLSGDPFEKVLVPQR